MTGILNRDVEFAELIWAFFKSRFRRAAPAMPEGVGACRRRAPRGPRRACALGDLGAQSIPPTWARPVTILLRDGLFRLNVFVARA